MKGITRRSLVGGIGLVPLFARAGITAEPDPYSYVDPELAAALKKFPQGGPELNAANLAAIRAGDTNGPRLPQPELQPRRATVPGPVGLDEVPILIIDPKPNQKNRPAVLYIHGGGYVAGRADTNLRLAQQIAQGTGALTISVDYTLAPEMKFPLSLEQNYAVLARLHERAAQFGIDRNRIAVMGDSAGGGHAAMLAIAARDRQEFRIAYQCLIYPMLDDRTGSTRRVPSHIGHFVWTEANNRFGWTSLLGVPAGSDDAPSGAVPARIDNLAGLPPTFIGVGSIDLFYAEDLDYAKRLALAGVETELFVVPGAYHGFDVLAPTAQVTIEFNRIWQNALRRGLGIS